MKKNLEYENGFNLYFDIIIRNNQSEIELLEFCLREFQWEESKKTAGNFMCENDDFTIKQKMARLLELYDEVWEDSDLYPYYEQKKE